MTTIQTPTTTTGVNLDLAIEVLAHIEAFPEKWDQSFWASTSQLGALKLSEGFSCGTAYCFAGWAAHLSGNPDYEPALSLPDDRNLPSLDSADRREWYWDASYTKSGRSIQSTAADLLGLSDSEAADLFDGDNSKAKLYRLVSDYADVDIDELRAAVTARARDIAEEERLERAQIRAELVAAVARAKALRQAFPEAREHKKALKKAKRALKIFEA